MFESSVWVKTCLVAGTLLIGAYVIFGGTTVTRRKRRKKDVIPGLANIGNSCFLNALVQSLASCPLFMTWLSSRHTQAAPPLLDTLHSLLKALNNERGTGGDACAGEVLGALRGHGWVITSEEQDTHELFHVLTSTIEDEILSGAPVPSLLDISWLDVRREETPGKGVALKAAVWTLNTTTVEDLAMKSSVLLKEKLNGILCGHVQDLAHFRLSEERGGEGSERCGSEISAECGSWEGSKRCGGSETRVESERCTNGEGAPNCDKEGCESRAILPGQCSDNTQDAQKEGVITNRLSSRNSSGEKTGDVEQKSEGVCEVSDERLCSVTPRCDSKNIVVPNTPLHKPSRKHIPEAEVMQGTDNVRKKTRSEHQHDIPFRGYLASQLQCTICGHKNPAQWSSFESLSLSLPSLPWGEVSLQELLGTYITREHVSGVSCEGCTRMAAMPVKTTFTKQLTIGKLPDCLCFHVKRTVWLENGSAIKRRDHVTFPEFLVMDPYTYTTSITAKSQQGTGIQNKVPSEDTGSGFLENHKITALSQYATASHSESSPMLYVGPVQCDQLYKLQAVIVHVGDVFCGHFVTYRRGPINSRSKNRWFYTSDLLVREASLEEVRKANAYMILYEKVA